jgi:hypothetical protein
MEIFKNDTRLVLERGNVLLNLAYRIICRIVPSLGTGPPSHISSGPNVSIWVETLHFGSFCRVFTRPSPRISLRSIVSKVEGTGYKPMGQYDRIW